MSGQKEIDINVIKNFKLDIDEFDAISFFKTETGSYNFMIMKLKDTPDDYEISDLGHKFIMLFCNDNKSCDIEEAILGSPMHNLANFISGGSEGIIIKKCKKGEEIVARILGRSMNIAAMSISELVGKNTADVV